MLSMYVSIYQFFTCKINKIIIDDNGDKIYIPLHNVYISSNLGTSEKEIH